MHITTLHPDLRKNLRNLLQGYVEHCEFSEHLTGRIDFPLYYLGFKYGAPVFTHVGPGHDREDRPVVGFVGWNTPTSQLASQVLLQFIEILTQHPRVAGNAILRLLPVANPVALELDEDAPDLQDWDLLGHLAEQFKNQASHGLIEVHAADVQSFTVAGEIPPTLHQAIKSVGVTIPALRGRIAVPTALQVKPVHPEERWQLRLLVPSGWDDPRSIHAVARFLVRVLHAQTRLSRQLGSKVAACQKIS
ncbi:hypothetical protein OKA04_20485 [Luteolibacter flavescens]|uniref:Peptidase M14 carboxypeptidase A domain-containing protein n=1 Tax=Luteolibacter flavescens TaxID=1859460 RepID=A0ABT3FU64_9BACT|nr:hypothetical protein [Luteolibacter flavescens]MCW1887128.1 hypothetical protein [Luteolibacter flavescens]